MFKLFESWGEALPEQDPVQPPQGLYNFCRHYTRGFELPLLVMTVLSAVLAIFEVILFGYMGELVDLLSATTPELFFTEHSDSLVRMSLLVLLGIPAVVLFHAFVVYQALLGNYPMSIRWLAHRYLLKQSVSFYQDDFAGRISTKVMQTALSVRETVTKLLDVFVYVSVYFGAMVFLIGQADAQLMVPLVLWLVLYIVIQMRFLPLLKAASTEQANARSTMTGRVVDSYTNINTVKLFAHTDREADYAKAGMQGFLDTVYKQMRLVTGLNFSVQVINYVLAFSVCALSIWLWSTEAITVGAIAVAMSLALRLNGMSQWIMWEVSSLFENLGTVADGMKTIAQPIAIQDQPEAKNLVVSQGDIVFNNISFHYGEQDAVIKQLSLHIRAGEKIGLVGRSGAGKSTLVNLLMRFYDVDSGEILIDGQNIRSIKQDSIRQNIGMVTQDTSLLHRSIKENILYGSPQASSEQLSQAIACAQATDFINELSDDYGNKGVDVQVGERGVKLSGGQRQRIAIARVLLKNAPILLLDEATSALDSEVEAAIQDSLNQLMQGKTVIAIAHRLSTIAAMDRLVVIDEGQIVEMGDHQQLLAQGGIYAQLWQHQTGGFLGLE